VRLGLPHPMQGLSEVVRNPIYSTGMGLLMYARDNNGVARRSRTMGGNAKSALDRMISWFHGNF
jgi:cell division protein FtsA